MGLDAIIFVFWMLGFKPTFPLSFFTSIKRLFSSSLLSVIRVVSSAYLRLLIFIPAILIPACASSIPAFLMMYSAYKLNKQGNNIQPWHTPFPVWNQFIVLGPVLTVASWSAYGFLRRQVNWTGISISLLLHRVKEDDTSTWFFVWFVVSSWGTDLMSFFTFPIFFKCRMTIEWSMLSSSATSCVVVRGSALMIFSVDHW